MPNCPICGRDFPARRLNAHVNSCLDSDQGAANVDNNRRGGQRRRLGDPDKVFVPDLRIDRENSVPASVASRFGVASHHTGGVLYVKVVAVAGAYFSALSDCNFGVVSRKYHVVVSVGASRETSKCVTFTRSTCSAPGTLQIQFECTCAVPTYFAELPVDVALFECVGWGKPRQIASASFPLRACLSTHALTSIDPRPVLPSTIARSTGPHHSLSSSTRSLAVSPRSDRFDHSDADGTDGMEQIGDYRGLRQDRQAIPHGKLGPAGPLTARFCQRGCSEQFLQVLRPAGGFLGMRKIHRSVAMSSQAGGISALERAFAALGLFHASKVWDVTAKQSQLVTFTFDTVYLANSDARCSQSNSSDLPALHRAAADGNVALLAALLRACGAQYAVLRSAQAPSSMLPDSGSMCFGSMTPLDVACICAQQTSVDYLIRVAPLSARVTSGYGMHPLHFAVLSGSVAALNSVLTAVSTSQRARWRSRHDLHASDADAGEESSSSVEAALRRWAAEHVASQTALLAHSPNISTTLRALFCPVRLPDGLSVAQHRISAPLAKQWCTTQRTLTTGCSSIDILDACGNSPLSFAAAFGQRDAVTLLLTSNACRAVVSGSDNTPLTYALLNGHVHVALLLLLGESLVPCSKLPECSVSVDTVCNLAIQHSPSVEITARSAEVGIRGLGWRITKDANSMHALTALCHPSAVNAAGQNALLLATSLCFRGNTAGDAQRSDAYALLQLLVDVGCSRQPQLVRDGCCSKLTSPLHIAAANGDLLAVRILCLMESQADYAQLMEYQSSSATSLPLELCAMAGWLPLASSAMSSMGDDGRGRIFSRFCEPVRINTLDGDGRSLLDVSARAEHGAERVASFIRRMLQMQSCLQAYILPEPKFSGAADMSLNADEPEYTLMSPEANLNAE